MGRVISVLFPFAYKNVWRGTDSEFVQMLKEIGTAVKLYLKPPVSLGILCKKPLQAPVNA